jgi:prepilin-type N-terminal cleavage/methylation domain-containing protein/prepilin-type processing-associated H-X9-DG protein
VTNAGVVRYGPMRHGRGKPSPGYGRVGFTLLELLVVIGVIALLVAILFPVLGGVRKRAVVVKCANNLRQIGLAMMSYAATEPGGRFPRTTYDASKHLQLDNAGYLVPNSFGNSGYVGENNVPASLFLLMKTESIPSSTFVCPATDAVPGFVSVDPHTSSNWERIPENMNYSLATPFPTVSAEQNGFNWRNTMSAEFALAADINPGTRGGTRPPNNVTGPPHDAPLAVMAAANSNNHANQGQNVLYADGHVEYSTTPYCGAFRVGGIRDNIYTSGPGDGGITDDTALPVDKQDSVMLPTDDPGGK